MRVGWALLTAGAVLLGWVGWQLWGTTYVAQRHRADDVRQIERTWERGGTARVAGVGTAQAVVRIPRFGRSYAVPVWAGTSDDVLARGFGHVAGSAAPGGRGNLALAGHRITHGEPLRRMPELRVGDAVVVETAAATYTYRLTTPGDGLEVGFEDTWVVAPRPVNPVRGGVQPPAAGTGAYAGRLLTLSTCAELFHTDRRLVAFGRLVQVERRAPLGSRP